MGLIRASSGSVICDGVEVSRLPANEVPRHGIGYIPQGRRLFAELTVAENLEIGLMVTGKDHAFREQVLRCSTASRTSEPARRYAVRRRAADAGHRPRARASTRPCCLLDEPYRGIAAVND
jgi:branched-chain amino acid transport system ATP-binding protein